MALQQCSFRFSQREGVPFSGMHVSAQVVELAAHVQVDYFFENPFPHGIGPAVFHFPLSEEIHSDMNEGVMGGIIRGCAAHISNGLSITSWIGTEEESASRVDDPALSAAYLRHRPDLLQLSIPEIPSLGTAHIRVSLALPLLKYSPFHNAVEFCFPRHLAPADADLPAGSRHSWRDRWQQHALASNQRSISSLPEGLRGSRLPLPFSLVIDAQMASLGRISSPTHAITWETLAAGDSTGSTGLRPLRAEVCCLSDSAPLTTDLVIHFYPQDCEMCSNVRVEVTQESSCAMLTLYPDVFPVQLFQDRSSEVVFLVDCSGSMSQGLKIPSTIASLEILLRSLDPNCSFNIYRFGSSFQSLFPRSQAYSRESLAESLLYVASKIRPDLQGTKILPPLLHIFQENRKQSLMGLGSKALQLFVLTDGQVENPADVIAACQEASNHSPVRIWSIGVGQDASSFLVEGIARSTGGCASFVTDCQIGAQLDQKMVHLLRCATIPCISQIAIEWTHTTAMPTPRPSAPPMMPTPAIPGEFFCPITMELMKAPVIAMDGHTYERSAIESWFSQRPSSPMTNLPIETTLIPNIALRSLIAQFLNAPSPQVVVSAADDQPSSAEAKESMSGPVCRQAPFILPPFFAGKEYVVFAMFPDRDSFPFSFVRILFRTEGRRTQVIELPIQRIEAAPAASSSPIHLLGAKFLLHQLEEHTSHLHLKPADAHSSYVGPKPISVPEQVIADEMVDLGLRFGFPSSQTLLLAFKASGGTITPLRRLLSINDASLAGDHGNVALVHGEKVAILRYTISKPGKHGTAKAFVTYRDPLTGSLREAILSQRDLVIPRSLRPATSSVPSLPSQETRPRFSMFFGLQQFDGSYEVSRADLIRFLRLPAPCALEDFEFTFDGETVPMGAAAWSSIFALAVLDLYFPEHVTRWDVGAAKTRCYCAASLSCRMDAPLLKHLIASASNLLRRLKNEAQH